MMASAIALVLREERSKAMSPVRMSMVSTFVTARSSPLLRLDARRSFRKTLNVTVGRASDVLASLERERLRSEPKP